MLAMREKELNMVNGGTVFGKLISESIGGSKFNVGDSVISISDPDLGVGTVIEKQYNRGWWYNVAFGHGTLYTSEDDLESPIM